MVQLDTVMPILQQIGGMATEWNFWDDENDRQQFYMYASVLRWMSDISPRFGITSHEYMVRQIAVDLNALRDLGGGLLPLECVLDRPWWRRIWVSHCLHDHQTFAEKC